MPRSISFIGVGNMGSRMARRLIAAGHKVRVCDPGDAARAAFEALGCRVTTRALDCVEDEIIIVMVADAAQLIDVVTGPSGLHRRRPTDNPPVIVVMSTVLPATCIQLQIQVGRDRARFVDAPVSGGLFAAEQGTLTIMAGGVPSDVDDILPVLELMGNPVHRCGSLGSGQILKIINNIIGITNIYGAAEAFLLAAKNGISIETLAPVLETSSGRNFFTESADKTRSNYGSWAETPEVFASLGNIIRKDLSLAHQLAEASGLDLPVLEAVRSALASTPDSVRRDWLTL
jgi:3-hydroxyisobutyrate dehydrogenase